MSNTGFFLIVKLSSGGGSGSGCGSGSGGLVGYGNLTAGSANVSVNGMIVHLTWGAGTFNGHDPYPTLSCENSLGENVTASWSQPFFVSIALSREIFLQKE